MSDCAHACNLVAGDQHEARIVMEDGFVVRTIYAIDALKLARTLMSPEFRVASDSRWIVPGAPSLMDAEIVRDRGRTTIEFNDYGDEDFEVALDAEAERVLAELAVSAVRARREGSAREALAEIDHIIAWKDTEIGGTP
jgi:hypothetical protein